MGESERDRAIRLAKGLREKRIETAVEAADVELRQTLAFIDVLYPESQNSGDSIPAATVASGDAKLRSKTRRTAKREAPPVVAAMRQTFPKMEGPFDRVRLTERIKKDFPKLADKLDASYLRVRLTAMAKDGTIKVVRPGGGKAHTEYEYVGGGPVKAKDNKS
jgi:hypothetical protein